MKLQEKQKELEQESYRQSQGDSKNAGGLAAPHGLCRGGRRGR